MAAGILEQVDLLYRELDEFADDSHSEASFQTSRATATLRFYFEDYPEEEVFDILSEDMWNSAKFMQRSDISSREVEDGDGWYIKLAKEVRRG